MRDTHLRTYVWYKAVTGRAYVGYFPRKKKGKKAKKKRKKKGKKGGEIEKRNKEAKRENQQQLEKPRKEMLHVLCFCIRV